VVARSRWAPVSAAFAVVGALIAAASPAAAVTLPPTASPLPGSSFQGGDGNQTDQAPYIDWAGRDAVGQVAHSDDPNANDDVFKGGTKEDDPGAWAFTTEPGGNTPGGTNIRDAWASVDQVGGKTLLYLASARHSDTGTSFITFELNRDGRFWDNGHAKKVPCRREGDILITYQPHGSDQAVIVQRWHTLTTDPNGSGCAVTGSLVDATLHANVDVQGAFNPAMIGNLLPGSQTSIGPRLFMEAAIDLAKVAQAAFGDPCLAYTSLWMHSRSSTSESANMQDVVWPRPFELRTCAAAGTKFVDQNANGQRDPGEPGIAGARIFADYDNNGVYDPGEPFAVSDSDGNYVVDDIRRNPYTLRETTLSGTNPNRWRCSYPHAGVSSPAGSTSFPNGLAACGWTVDGAAEPYARGRDFGNYKPAHLIVRKQVFPAGDPTQFDIAHPGGTTFSLGDGDQAGGNVDLTPGTYSASETPNPDFSSSVACGPGAARAAAVPGTSGTITLKSGETGVCTFYNARQNAPGIAIDKAGPETAVAGDRLDYTLYVTNVGTVAFAEADVKVTDPRCDSDPRRVTGDDSLDPQEVWTYVCSQQTDQPTNACVTHPVVNSGRVEADGVSDSSSMTTTVTCPTPDIALQKLGPASAPAGAIIRYVFYVYNKGDIAFPAGGNAPSASNLSVTDDRCDADPVLAEKFSSTGAPDGSPGSFDPGDVWAFTCLSTTPRNDAACTPSTLTNTGMANAVRGGLSASASDSWDTALTCAPPPPGPPPEEPLPPVPPVPPDPSFDPSLIPSIINPPRAGVAGVAGVGRLPSCIRRGSVVSLRVSRAAAVGVFVAGKPVRGLSIRPLQSRVVIRLLRNFRPGRYAVTARVRFQRGSGTAPLRLVRQVRVCGPLRRVRQPVFTG
jgi:hypothetical protein